MKWEFTDVEFKVLCNRYLGGYLPRPLSYTSRTLLQDDYEHELSETEARLRERLDPGFGPLFAMLERPEVAIFTQVWCDGDLDNPKKRIRVHAARQGRRACVITQLPGETVYHSGGFTVVECEPEALPALVTAELPEAEAARGPAVPIMVQPPEPEPEMHRNSHSAAFDSFDDPDDAATLAFWNKPAEWTAACRVVQGRSKYGPRGIVETTLLWRDLPGDGRYLIDLAEPEPKAVGATTSRIAKHIGLHVDTILRSMTDRGEEVG